MAKQRKLFITHAGALAHQLVRAVRPHAMIFEFARSYARRHDRVGVVDEPGRVRELESTLGRESILVMVAEVHRLLPTALGARKGRPLNAEEAEFARVFWPEFMAALGRMLDWDPEEFASEREALDRDLLMYRRWSERAPYPGAPVPQDGVSPFLDRCALLLDPSTMEEARLAAAEFEKELAQAAARILDHLGRTAEEKPHAKPHARPASREAPRLAARKPAPTRAPQRKPKKTPKRVTKRRR